MSYIVPSVALATPALLLQRPGLVAGFGARNRLFEVGWLKFPSLMTAVWAAQHLVYMRSLASKLAGGWVQGCRGWDGSQTLES